MNDDDSVARNRATPRRRVPGRPELGDAVTRRLRVITAVAVVSATVVLVVALTLWR